MNEIVEFAEYEQLWIDELTNFPQNKKFCVYIENPFCLSHCTYCIYHSAQFNKNDFLRYYNEFILDLLDKHSRILGIRTPDVIYFGGGTSSLMTNEMLENFIKKFPNFKNIKHKHFEIHPFDVSTEKIMFLLKKGFNYFSMGIQSLNENVLSKVHRLSKPVDTIAQIIRTIQENGAFINCDLMAFLLDDIDEDIEIFSNTLEDVIKILSPNFIDIYPMQQKIYAHPQTEEHLQNNYMRIYKLRCAIQKVLNNTKDCQYSCVANSLSLNIDNIIKSGQQNYYLSKESLEVFKEKKFYNSSGRHSLPSNQSCLAIGAFGKIRPYSYISPKYCWSIENINWDLHFIADRTAVWKKSFN